MKFTQLASGSTANAYLLTFKSGKRILIECGLPWGQLKKKLHFDLTNIVCCLCSHSHADHSKCVTDLLMAGIQVYASQGTLEALHLDLVRNVHVIVDQGHYALDGFEFQPFLIEHDAPEPMGFVVKEIETGEMLFFATDTALVKLKFVYPFTIIAIECSYDYEILAKRIMKGKISETLAKRLLDTHMELQNTINYLDRCDLSKCREIHLIHCSGGNLDRRWAKAKVEKRFFIETKTVNDMEKTV